MTRILREVQRALEVLYRVDAAVDVNDFVISGEHRSALGVGREPREQLLLRQDAEGLEVGLFIDEVALKRLEKLLGEPEAGPGPGPGEAGAGTAGRSRWRRRQERVRALPIDETHLGEFLLVVEGVSHFLYVILRAREHRPFSGLELELQAEVDKYLLSLLVAWSEEGEPPEDLRERLFERVSFLSDLSREEQDRYRTANAAADGYVASLETRFVRRRALPELLTEVRRFYRLDCAGKLDHIVKRAA